MKTKILEYVINVVMIPLSFILPILIIIYYMSHFLRFGFIAGLLLLDFFLDGIIVTIFTICVIAARIYFNHFKTRKHPIRQEYKLFRKAFSTSDLATSNVTVIGVDDVKLGKTPDKHTDDTDMRIFSCIASDEQHLEILHVDTFVFGYPLSKPGLIEIGDKGILHYRKFNGKNYFEKFELDSRSDEEFQITHRID